MKLTKQGIKDILAEKLQAAIDEKYVLAVESTFGENCDCPGAAGKHDCECHDTKEETEEGGECEACSEEDEDGVDVDLDESTGEYSFIELNEETLVERRIVVRVNSRGQRIKRVKCPKGRIVRIVNGRKVCVTPTGRAKLVKKLAVRRANRTKKARGAGYKKRTNFRRQRAIRKRKQMGIPDSHQTG